MAAKVFVSHAGTDNARAVAVAELLRDGGLEPLIDDYQVKPGDVFLDFMETALDTCSYCLLLWSQAAAQTPWVRTEWQVAFQDAVTRGQSFLVVGRLEEVPLPRLLRTRVWIDLFPDPQPGVGRLLEVWQDDETAAEASARPVQPPARTIPTSEEGETLYITSQSFGKTFPIKVDLDAPALLLIDRIVTLLDAPRQTDHKGLFGCRYEYNLSGGEGKTILTHQLSLRSQGVSAKDVLWLEITIKPFAAGESTGDLPTATTFRGEQQEHEQVARRVLLEWINHVGLGF